MFWGTYVALLCILGSFISGEGKLSNDFWCFCIKEFASSPQKEFPDPPQPRCSCHNKWPCRVVLILIYHQIWDLLHAICDMGPLWGHIMYNTAPPINASSSGGHSPNHSTMTGTDMVGCLQPEDAVSPPEGCWNVRWMKRYYLACSVHDHMVAVGLPELKSCT